MVRLAKSFVGSILVMGMLLSGAVAAPTTTATATTTKNVATTTVTSAAAATTDFILPTLSTTAPATATTTTGTSNSTLTSCPGPLIPNTMGLQIPTCLGSCCIKCPAVNSLYEPHKVDNVLQAAYITRQVSLGTSVFMAISYLVLPGKRSQPHISVLFLTVSLSLWYAAFDVMPGVSNSCINDFEQSTGHNSRLCGIQGVLIIYLTQTSALWCSLLIYKLHMLAVWRSNWIDMYYGWFTGVCWVLPLAFAIPVAVKNLAEYPGIGFSCLVSNANLNTYLFYPTAVYMYPAMMCHVVTVGKMIHLAVMSSKVDTGLSQLSANAKMKFTTTMQAKRLLRGQWRPAMMMASVMSSLTVFWLFYFIDAHRIANVGPTTPWLQQWVVCVMTYGAQGKSSDETQTLCAKGTAPHLPSIPWFTAAEMLLAIIGIVVGGIFISKSEFWEEWAYLLSNLIRRGKTGSGSLRGRSSPDEGGSSAPPHIVNKHQQPLDDRKGIPSGMMRSNSKASLNEPTGTQWYDMDDLLDREYDENGNRRLQRSMSSGSRSGMAINPGPYPISEPPRYNTFDTAGGDILYRPPAQDPTSSHWSPSAQTLATPGKAYFGGSDHDRFVEQPVVPSPVPRTPKQSNSQPIFLSSPKISSSPASPISPTGRGNGSLSPMPSRSRSPPVQRANLIESGPIIAVATRGSPAQAYQQPTSSYPSSPASQKQRAELYNSNGSGDQIMVASRESVGISVPSSRAGTSNMRINTVQANALGQMDQRTKSPAPSVPTKSPHRQPQPGYMSPPLRTPTSPSNGYYRD
ncbi:hypothetical protein EDD21DRAFT_382381 [Dissophora ornata]|nr:hypothetical protein BGZ58_010182 [Dissophora ornata]KAI8598466.1 hypothetical protein EDD21DRAFT_382381 [Dissophora ornata]